MLSSGHTNVLTKPRQYGRIFDMRKVSIITFIIFFSIINYSHAFWIWTPNDKKWTNPKWSAKNTPKEQFEFAKGIFDSSDYKNAYIEFNKVLRHFPGSYEAADSQFYMGVCLEKMDKIYDAYLAYQKVIDKYPFSDKMERVLEQELKIADILSQAKAKNMGFSFPQYYYALIIYRKIIENSPYSNLAPLSQYKIGLVLKSIGNFNEAKTEFEKVVSTYPESEWAEAAKFQAAQSASSASLKSEYDQELTRDAKGRFEEFLKNHPDAELSKEAREEVYTLSDKEAEKDFLVGQFYEKQKSYSSAEIYYEDVIRKYPRSVWAQKSFEKIQILEKERKI